MGEYHSTVMDGIVAIALVVQNVINLWVSLHNGASIQRNHVEVMQTLAPQQPVLTNPDQNTSRFLNAPPPPRKVEP